jgi:hypothetical protein
MTKSFLWTQVSRNKVHPFLFFTVLVLAACSSLSLPLHAQSFEAIAPLVFTMPVGSPGPLPQLVTVATTGKNFDIVWTASTNSGGNWLAPSPGGNATPQPITVSVVKVTSLAAGTYTGQITFQQWQGSLTMTVPVTLIVEGSGTSFFDALPGGLSFSMKTGGKNPPAQIFQIRNGGSGTLNWTVSASTADGGGWLGLSSSGDKAPANETVSINASDLPGGGATPGTFDGQLLFQSGGDSVTVPVTVTVGGSVFAQIDPINLTMPVGGLGPLPQVLSLASTGTNFDFGWNSWTSTGTNWLTVTPIGENTPQPITVSIAKASTLPVGIYTGEIIFTQFPYAGQGMTVLVTLTVEPLNTSFFDALPGQLTFSMITAGLTPPTQTISARNGGAGKLKWTLAATTADGGAWLKATPASGSESGSAAKTISASVVPSLLPGGGTTAGTFAGQLVFQTASDSVTVPVSMTVGSSVFAQVNPISFTMVAGSAGPLPQVLPVASTGTNFDFVASTWTTSGGNWLTFAGGAECCATPAALILSVVGASALPVGNYLGQVSMPQFPYAGNEMNVPVTLTVAPSGAAFFDSIPGQSSFSFVPGSSGAAQIVPIDNGGPGSVDWTSTITTADGGKWLKISPVKGTTPSVASVKVTTKKLPGAGKIAGMYVGQELFKTITGNVTVPVSVNVGNSVFVELDALTFSAKVGVNPQAQTVTVDSTGTNFDFTWLASTGSGGNWLSLSGGQNCCATPWVVTVTVSSSQLAAGTYVGQVIFFPTPFLTSAMTVPVVLTVTP